MGGCCCSARKPHIHGAPLYYYYPSSLEASETFTGHSGAASAFAAGLLVELNLNTSTPDTFRSPPAPLPYDVLLGCPSTDSDSVRKSLSASSFESLAICEDLDDPDYKTPASPFPESPRKPPKLDEVVMSETEEEDACVICLEEYDKENPKLTTKCRHHFHLSCILQWMEKSDTCPMCDQVYLLPRTQCTSLTNLSTGCFFY